MSYQVFISSSGRDRSLVQDLTHRLEEAGVKVFSGEATEREDATVSLDPHLMKADEVVVLLTDHSVNSPWVLFEMGAAWGKRKRLTPIIVDLEDRELPDIVRTLSYVKYGDLRSYISDLEGRIRKGQSLSAEGKPKVRSSKRKAVTASGRRLAPPQDS